MQQLLIPLLLFILRIHFNNGYAIPKTELHNPIQLVYKEKDGNTLIISDLEKPTLNEITYYHIVEKPYPQEEEVDDFMDLQVHHPHPSIKVVNKVKDGNTLIISDPEKQTLKDITYYQIVEKPYPQVDDLDESIDLEVDVFAKANTGDDAATDERIDPLDEDGVAIDKSNQGQRKKREVSIEKPESKKKRTYRCKRSQSGSRFKRCVSRINYDDESNSENDILIDSTSDDYYDITLQFIGNNYVEDPDVIEYIEYYDSAEDNNNSNISVEEDKESEESDKFPEGSVSIDDIISEEEKRPNKVPEVNSQVTNEPQFENEVSIENGNNESSQADEGYSGANEDTSSANFNVLSFINDIFKLVDAPTTPEDESIKTNLNKPTNLNILKGIFTNIIKTNVTIHSNPPTATKPIDITPSKDKTDDTEKVGSTNKPISNLKDTELTTEAPHDHTTPTSSTSQSDNEHSKDFNTTSIDTEVTTETVQHHTTLISISSQSDIEHNKDTNTIEKDIELTTESVQEYTTQISTSNQPNIENSKNNGTTSSPLGFNTDTSFGEHSKEMDNHISNNADKFVQAPPTPPMQIDDKFWKFFADFSGQYLEALKAHMISIIKDQIEAQVKEHLDAHKKDEQNIVLEKEKDKVQEDKPIKENNIEPFNENGEKNVTHPKKHHSDHNDTLSNNKHKDKVTNVYIFYANDKIEEIVKTLHEHNKNSSTNIYTFGPNHHGLNNENENINHSKEVITSPSIDSDQPHTNSFYTTENAVILTTMTTEQTPKSTPSTVELIPAIDSSTENADKASSTEKVFPDETVTESNHLTSESDTTKESSPIEDATDKNIETETITLATEPSEAATKDSNPTTEPTSKTTATEIPTKTSEDSNDDTSETPPNKESIDNGDTIENSTENIISSTESVITTETAVAQEVDNTVSTEHENGDQSTPESTAETD